VPGHLDFPAGYSVAAVIIIIIVVVIESRRIDDWNQEDVPVLLITALVHRPFE
jgi:hypothetical protein